MDLHHYMFEDNFPKISNLSGWEYTFNVDTFVRIMVVCDDFPDFSTISILSNAT
jgi:hypothetical protein